MATSWCGASIIAVTKTWSCIWQTAEREMDQWERIQHKIHMLSFFFKLSFYLSTDGGTRAVDPAGCSTGADWGTLTGAWNTENIHKSRTSHQITISFVSAFFFWNDLQTNTVNSDHLYVIKFCFAVIYSDQLFTGNERFQTRPSTRWSCLTWWNLNQGSTSDAIIQLSDSVNTAVQWSFISFRTWPFFLCWNGYYKYMSST